MLCSHQQEARRMLFLLPSRKIEGRKEKEQKTINETKNLLGSGGSRGNVFKRLLGLC